MVTIKSIAESLGLSSATVSRALRNDESLSIAPETRMRILMTAERMGYVRKSVKTSEEPTRDKKIVVLHKKDTFRHQIDSSYYFAVRTGIEDTCHKYAFHCSFIDIEEIEGFSDAFDGVLIVGNYLKEQYIQLHRIIGATPMASIGITSYFPDTIDHVTHSNAESIRIALDYLFENGHVKIGYLGVRETPGTELFGSRKQCFINFMKNAGCYYSEWLYESDHGLDRVDEGYHTMNSWIAQKQPLPTAIFCANDPVALGAVKALLENKISVPEDISIVAHDGSYPTQYSFPALTTVDVHPYQLGVEAVHLLQERILEDRKIVKKLFLYPELIIRDSVKRINL